MTTPHVITSVKSPKSIIIKKALIIGASALGLVAAGAVAFVAAKSSTDEDSVDTAE